MEQRSELTANSYADIPQETKDYAKFICDSASLGDTGSLYGLDNMRVKLHAKMAERYGLDYDSTKDAVDSAVISLTDAFRPKHVAILVDAKLIELKRKTT